MVTLATSESDLSTFVTSNVTVDELNSTPRNAATDLGFIDNLHSPLGRYDLVRSFYNKYGRHILQPHPFRSLALISASAMRRDCEDLHLSNPRILSAMQAYVALRTRFVKVHHSSLETTVLPVRLPALTTDIRRELVREAHLLPGQVTLSLGALENGHPDARAWYSAEGFAIATASDSVPKLGNHESQARFTARIVLRREADTNGFWLDVSDYWIQSLR
jgi:hypothetical protein